MADACYTAFLFTQLSRKHTQRPQARVAVSSGSQGSVVTEPHVAPDLPSRLLGPPPPTRVLPAVSPAGLGGPLSELTPWLETLLCIALGAASLLGTLMAAPGSWTPITHALWQIDLGITSSVWG